MSGLGSLVRNIVNYQSKLRPGIVRQLKKVTENPEPKAVMFSCMDSRVIMTRMLQTSPGDMFLVRNAGNIVPHAESVSYDAVSTEPGALELACVVNNIRHVLVCGHADCKAMHLLHSIREDVDKESGTPLQLWLKKHGRRSVEKYTKWLEHRNNAPLEFQGETSDRIIQAYIDPEDKFNEVDKFSQINTLQQLQNITSHPIIFDKLHKNEVRVNALWFDINDGLFYMFSREKKQFMAVNENNCDHFIKDGES